MWLKNASVPIKFFSHCPIYILKAPKMVGVALYEKELIDMMRIDAYNQVYAAYKPKSVKNRSNISSSQAPVGTDQLQLSSFGQELAIAKNAVKNSPDVREDLVAEMSAKYGRDGQTPSVDMDDFASVLMAQYRGAIG